MTQIIIFLTYLWFALIIKLIYVVYKSDSPDELCNAVLTSQDKKCHLYSFYLLSSTEIILLYIAIKSYKMFVESPYLVYNTYTFLILILSSRTLQFDLCYLSFKCSLLSWIFVFLKQNPSRISTILLQSFCCCCFFVVTFFPVPTFSSKNKFAAQMA